MRMLELREHASMEHHMSSEWLSQVTNAARKGLTFS